MKKLIWLLIAILALNLTVFTAAAEETQEIAVNYDDYYFLNNTGVLDGTGVSFDNLTAPITRAEFVSLAIKLATKEPENISNAFFKDVPGSHKAAKAIYAAVSRGMISKADNFYPDNIVTLEQADKITVAALGYGEYADLGGGWAAGYIMQATSLNLNSGVTSKGELTKYDALCILRNACDADVMRLVQVGDDREYKAFDGQTPLTEIYDIHKVKGIISENGITGIKTSISGEKADRVKINGITYFAGVTNACDYIGQNVTAYYTDDDEIFTLVHAEPDKVRNKIITVMSEQIISYSGNVFKYYDENERTQSLRTTPSLSVIYNGKKLTDYNDANILIKSGEITFIDNNDDNVFDVALSYDYESYYVEALNASSYTVVDGKSDVTTTRKLVLDPEKKTVRIFDSEGVLSNFDAISNDSVITAFTSSDGSYVEVYTYNSSEETVILGVGEENGKRIIYTEAKEYIVENSYKGDIRIGQPALIYINAYGHAAFIDSPGSDLNPAYLINYARTSSIAETREMKILTGDGDRIVVTLAEKMKVNDVLLDSSNENTLWGGVRKPILYKTNKDGLVTHVYTPQSETETTSELRKIYSDTDNNNDGIFDTSVYYRTSDGMFVVPHIASNNVYPHYCTTAGAVFFGVPYDQANATDEDYVIYDTGNRNESAPFASVSLYSFKNSGLVGICEAFYNAGDATSVSWGNTPYAVVSDPKPVMNEDGEIVQSFTNLTNGMEMYIKPDSGIVVHEGDMLLYSINKSTGDIAFANKLYCKETNKAYVVTGGSHGRSGFKGTITKIEQGAMTMEVETGEIMTLRIRGTIFDMVNKRKPVMTNSTSLSVGNEIVVYITEAVPDCIMILN